MTRRRVVFIVVIAATLLGAALWWRRPPRADLQTIPRQNVLLITIDTLRADALGSYGGPAATPALDRLARDGVRFDFAHAHAVLTLPSHARSEEHTSELQSHSDLVCRLLLEKKKKKDKNNKLNHTQ